MASKISPPKEKKKKVKLNKKLIETTTRKITVTLQNERECSTDSRLSSKPIWSVCPHVQGHGMCGCKKKPVYDDASSQKMSRNGSQTKLKVRSSHSAKRDIFPSSGDQSTGEEVSTNQLKNVLARKTFRTNSVKRNLTNASSSQ